MSICDTIFNMHIFTGNRLKTLQRLHSETAGFSVRVGTLESKAEQLEAEAAGNALVLEDVKQVCHFFLI